MRKEYEHFVFILQTNPLRTLNNFQAAIPNVTERKQ